MTSDRARWWRWFAVMLLCVVGVIVGVVRGDERLASASALACVMPLVIIEGIGEELAGGSMSTNREGPK